MDNFGDSAARLVNEVTIKKQKSMEALDKLRTYATDSRRPSALSTASSASVGLTRKNYSAAAVNGSPCRNIGSGSNTITADTADPQLVDTAAKFVQDIIDKAKTEAAKKLNSEQIGSQSLVSPAGKSAAVACCSAFD